MRVPDRYEHYPPRWGDYHARYGVAELELTRFRGHI
jgi:hypothetical protein